MPRLAIGQMLVLQVISAAPGAPALRLRYFGSASGVQDNASQMTAVRSSLASALADLGVTVDEGNLLSAQALVRFGVTVTGQNLGDVRRGIAQQWARQPETVALAKSLNLSLSPAILRALDTLFAARPDRLLMSIVVPLRADAQGIADQLQRAVRAATWSVENKLLTGNIDSARSDLRSYLLRMAAGGDASAEAVARHLEGQMLTNAARSHCAGEPEGAIFVAFVASSQGKTHPVEMRLRPDDSADGDEPEPHQPSSEGGGVGATLRIPTENLGQVTASLHLGADGQLSCRLAATDPDAAQRIERSLGSLTDALARAGFPAATARAEHVAPVSPKGGAETPRTTATRPLRALDLSV